ncbi:MAG: AsmA family protein [Arenicellales bacterium]
MTRSHKIILFIVAGLVGLLALIVMSLHFFVDTTAYKAGLETAASRALGMEVKVGGRLGVAFFPGLRVTLKDLHVRNGGADVASAKSAILHIAVLPLLHHEVRIKEIDLMSPTIFIEQGDDGKFNFGTWEQGGGSFPAIDVNEVSFTDGTLRYADKLSGAEFQAVGCNLGMRGLGLSGGKNTDLLQHLSATGTCGSIRAKELVVSDFTFSIAGKEGVFDLKPLTMRIFGAQATGDVQANFSGAVPHYHVHYTLPQFRIDEFLKTLSPNAAAHGTMDFDANLTMQGKTMDEMKRSAAGDVLLRGGNLTLEGRDLDQEFSRFESSQNFNLVDVGAFFFAGPLGLAVTKGYNFASILQGSGGSSTIRVLVSNWRVEHGVAEAQDVAMATKENRIALKGKLDFVNDRFDDVTIALIDAKGCAKVRQRISGPFQKPVVERPNVFKSLAGPALKLLKKGRDLFPGGECEVFYTGPVKAPK